MMMWYNTNVVVNGAVVQLVRTPACHAGGRGFEPLLRRQKKAHRWCAFFNEICRCASSEMAAP